MRALYNNDARSSMALSAKQRMRLDDLVNALGSPELPLITKKCLCGRDNDASSWVISEKDRLGIPVRIVLCLVCGLIRNDMALNDEGMRHFYQNYYRDIWDVDVAVQSYFAGQVKRGQDFYRFMLYQGILGDIHSVTEIGCGAGGVLVPFSTSGMMCCGFDYDEGYVAFGQSQGLDLRLGDFRDLVADNSVDLIILSHVMEHFSNPLSEMVDVIGKVKEMHYLVVEVPGIFMVGGYYRLLHFFQFAHVYTFYQAYLNVFFKSLNMEILYGDETCRFLLRKPAGWAPPTFGDIYDPSLTSYAAKIITKLKIKYWLDRIHLNKILHAFAAGKEQLPPSR